MKINMSDNRKMLIYIAIGGIIFVIFIMISVITLSGSFFNNSGKEQERVTPLENPEGPGLSNQTTNEDEQINMRSSLVQALVRKVPYKGSNFSFYYSYNTNEFILYLKPGNQASGNQEFDQFLKDNGVESRTWITNLKTVSVEPNPESL